jgi:hypothetical protein
LEISRQELYDSALQMNDEEIQNLVPLTQNENQGLINEYCKEMDPK